MSKWHAANICRKCWDDIMGPTVEPMATARKKEEVCCYCGIINTDGIFLRDDAEIILCEHFKPDGPTN